MLPLVLLGALSSALLNVAPRLSLAPRATMARAVAPLCSATAGAIEVSVTRTAAGGLGIEVDPDTNVVASNSAQPGLNLGDVIVAVNGELCGTKYVGALLTPGTDTYSFSVERGTPAGRQALEAILLRLTIQVANVASVPSIPLAEVTVDADDTAKMLALVSALEAGGPATGTSIADLSGFWRLRFTDDAALGAGLSGFGLMQGCTAAAQFQLYGQPEPDSVQCVEVIANQAVRGHQVASLQGTANTEDDGTVTDVYTRVALGGAPQEGSGTQTYPHTLSYLGASLRICRAAGEGGAMRVYEKQSSEAAQGELQTLAAAPVVVVVEKGEEAKPRWQVADEERRSYGNGGSSPMGDTSGIP